MNKGLSKKITLLNFLFTIGIVIYHSKDFQPRFATEVTPPLECLYRFNDLLGFISLGFFFTVSAYLLYLGVDSGQKLTEKIKKRLVSLGIPFLVWNLLYFAVDLSYSLLKKAPLSLSVTDVLLGFSFEPYDGPFWYIFALICLLALSPLLLRLKKHPRVFLALIAVVFVGCGAAFELVPQTNPALVWLVRMANYLPTYMLGAYLALCREADMTRDRFETVAVSRICGVVSVGLILYFSLWNPSVPYVNWILLKLLPFSVWLSVRGIKLENMRVPFPLTISFFLYAAHSLLITLYNGVFLKLFGLGSLPPILAVAVYLVLLALIYLTCLLGGFVAKKCFPKKLFFALTGGRVQ